MKKRGLFVLVWLLCGCQFQQPYDLHAAAQSTLEIPDDAYHLAGQTLIVLEGNEYEEATVLYYVADEEALTKVLQYSLDQQQYEIAYQSEAVMDLDAIAADLSLLNPFDISLTQSDTIYTDGHDELLYTAHHIKAEILDSRYAQAKAEAEHRVQALIDDTMTTDEKIAAIHDDIIIHSCYEKIQEETVGERALFQAAGVLIDGKGVCTGYSRAFMLMAEAAGIPALYVSAAAMNHGWNYVQDEDGWRHIDVTWDDPIPDQGQNASATFLNMDEASFFEDGSHTLDSAERKKIIELADRFF